MKNVSVTTVLGVVGALLLGRCTADVPPPPVITQTFVDTVPPAQMMALIEHGALENSGLRAKLKGYESRQPNTIIRTDTFVTPPDTVLQLVRVEGESLLVAPLVKDSALWRPELHRFDVSRCDDGWSWKSGSLICDKARLGHLSLFGEASAEANPFGPPTPTAEVHAGLAWQACYRCGTRVSLGTDQRGRASLTVRHEWKVF